MSRSFLARAGWAIRAWQGRGRAKGFPPPLAFLTDPIVDSLAIAHRLPPGTLVVARDYERPNRAEWARRLARIARDRRLVLLVAGDFRLAAAIGADGLHLPEGQARGGMIAPALNWLRQGKRRLTVSAHSLAALRRAEALRADAAFLSPAFSTRSHPDRPALGVLGYGSLARAAGLPVIALGGIDRVKTRRLAALATSRPAALGSIRLFQ
ncbi:MAG: thiamine phosphate synthase [Rhodospirillales bacterium]|nr:thiamine phosphate synthase [Rhodospirillales bacterium]